jgi:RNA polymerase sigma factor (sigma-70 family)
LANEALRRVLDHIRRRIDPSGPGSDRALLQAYAATRDEAAFTELVRRHAGLVRGVARRVLGDAHAAEDVGQATFLVLARRAGSVQWEESVANWLHGVAYHLALKARDAARRTRQMPDPRPPDPGPAAAVAARELAEVLDAELARLPARLRAPLVLCYLEGRTRDEAAALLGVTASALKGQLERGREMLRARLLKRGYAQALALTAVALAQDATAAPAGRWAATALAVSAGKCVAASAVEQMARATLPTATVSRWVKVALLVGIATVGGIVLGERFMARKPVAASRPAASLKLERLEGRALPSFGFGGAFSFGGPNSEFARRVATDAAGNVYLCGNFAGTVDFDPDPSKTFNLTPVGTLDVYAAKYTPGGAFVWATHLGSAVTPSLAVQGSDVYVAYAPSGNTNDTRVTKLSAAAGTPLWPTPISLGSGGINRVDVAVGPSGSVYVTGTSSSQAFVTRLDASGAVVWTRTPTGGSASGRGVGVDSSENVYVTGIYSGTTDFDPGPGTFSLTSRTNTSGTTPSQDTFVWKLDSSGGYVWAGSLGSNGADVVEAIAVDGTGNVAVIGRWGNNASLTQLNDFDPGPGILTLTYNGGPGDVFVVQLVPDTGGALKLSWAKSFGGFGDEYGNAVAVDGAGNIYMTGVFEQSVDFDPGLGSHVLTSAGTTLRRDAFVSKLDVRGNFVAAAALGGSMTDEGYGITVDVFRNVYTTGGFRDTIDLDPSAGTYNLTALGSADAYVIKLTQSGLPTASAVVNDGAAQRSMVTRLAVTFSTAVTLDPGAFTLQRAGGAAVALNQSVSVLNGQTVAVLTFTGPGTTADSLDDGNYTLTVSSARVRDAQGNALDGDGDGVAGGDYRLSLHRLYGDASGDRRVDSADFFLFRQAFGRPATDPLFLAYLDFNGDGQVDSADFFQFRARFGTTLAP